MRKKEKAMVLVSSHMVGQDGGDCFREKESGSPDSVEGHAESLQVSKGG